MKLTTLPKGNWKGLIGKEVGGNRPGKSVCIVRYGGFGDMIMMSSILPALKEEGYYITINTTERGADMMKADPHVDEILYQETDQVPNNELSDYWASLAKYFDRFINLSESVEVRLLPVPGMPEYEWSKEKIHEHFNRNYLEETHLIAGVPLPPRPKFYPTKSEYREAKNFRDSLGRQRFTVMYSLSGSSIHKAWPHMDQLLARLLYSIPDIRIVTVGDHACQILEVGWEKERRVIRKSGKWSIRKTLAIAEECDLVFGTETGVLNSVGCSDVPKIVLLSHSTEENLTKHWNNTVAIASHDTPCYPCHRMHYGAVYCDRDIEHKQARCAVNIGVDEVYRYSFFDDF